MSFSHLGSLSPTATSDDLSVKIETLVGTISKLKVSQKSRIGGFTLEHIRLGKPPRMSISQMSQLFGTTENDSESKLDWVAIR